MKTKNLFLLPALIAVLNLLPAGRVTAQTFTILHSFTAGSGSFPFNYTNNDGANLNGLILSGNALYGTSLTGGSRGGGTGFKVKTEGAGGANLDFFCGYSTVGGNPEAGFIFSGKNLFGGEGWGRKLCE